MGHTNSPQITPSLIPNLPSDIVQFVCGFHQSLFLDSKGNVYSVGNNSFGSLGLGHFRNQNVLSKILYIPPIQTISCVNASCYLIDCKENIWSFGYNNARQLGHSSLGFSNVDEPRVIGTLKGIQQISYGSTGHHVILKNSENQIFVIGDNSQGQLGTGDTQSVLSPKEIDSQYSTIWRDELGNSQAKSARK